MLLIVTFATVADRLVDVLIHAAGRPHSGLSNLVIISQTPVICILAEDFMNESWF